jgi:S1-C subfamily serine protease
VTEQFTAEAVEDTTPHGTLGPSGIEIKELSKESPSKKIGLNTGDRIFDVNGKPVNSTSDLVTIIESASQDQNMIRIARVRKGGAMDPIYINVE